MRAQFAVPVVLAARAGSDPAVSPAQVLLSEPEEAAALYRDLSRQPALSAACLGPEVTTQYGGRYRTVHTGGSSEGVGAKGLCAHRGHELKEPGLGYSPCPLPSTQAWGAVEAKLDRALTAWLEESSDLSDQPVSLVSQTHSRLPLMP